MTFTMLDLHALKTAKSVQTYGDVTIHTENGKLHRADGPAIYSSFHQEWFINGIRHRPDGPAILYLQHPMPSKEFPSGERIAEWFINGIHSASFQLDEKTFHKYWHKK